MKPVAYGGLRHLRKQTLGIPQQQELHVTLAAKFIFEASRGQPKSAAFALYDCPTGSGFTAHEQRNADETFIAYDRDLG